MIIKKIKNKYKHIYLYMYICVSPYRETNDK